jgi:cell division protein FtsB
LIALAGAVVWICFFDSHSLYRRYTWHRTADRLEIENEAMRSEIADLSRQIQKGLSDEMVEKIAREQYGMRREGQKVYRVETER